jgi:hypothetical protein
MLIFSSSAILTRPAGTPLELITLPLRLFSRFSKKIKKDLALPFFMEIIILLAWSIWQTRNSWIFNNLDPSVQCCRRIFKKEFSLVLLKAKPSLLLAMDAWIQDFHP